MCDGLYTFSLSDINTYCLYRYINMSKKKDPPHRNEMGQ